MKLFLTHLPIFTLLAYIAIAAAATSADSSFIAVVDCGSSGSRLFVYTVDAVQEDLPVVQQLRDSAGIAVVVKLEPGLSAFDGRPDEALAHIMSLAHEAARLIPSRHHRHTPFHVLATAGLRLMAAGRAEDLLQTLRDNLPVLTPFVVAPTHVRLITGETEALHSWVAINYIEGRLRPEATQFPAQTIGSIDMGGASAQIALQVQPDAHDLSQDGGGIHTVDLSRRSRPHFVFQVYVETLLNFGANVARARYLQALAASNESADPCLPVGMTNEWEETAGATHWAVVGTGQHHACRERLVPLLRDATAACGQPPCDLAAKARPAAADGMQWYGVSEYFYSSFDVFGLHGPYSSAVFNAVAEAWCRQPASELERIFASGGYPNARRHRFVHQCFKAAWVNVVLHDGYKFPVDTDAIVVTKFVRGAEVQWTLGAALALVLEQERAAEAANMLHTTHGFAPYWDYMMERAVFLLLAALSICAVVAYVVQKHENHHVLFWTRVTRSLASDCSRATGYVFNYFWHRSRRSLGGRP